MSRPRVMPKPVRVAVLTLAALLLVVTSGCAKSVPADDIEGVLANKYAGVTGEAPEADCPDDLADDVGASITCTLTLPDGPQLEVLVTATSVEGDQVRYDFKVQDIVAHR